MKFFIQQPGEESNYLLASTVKFCRYFKVLNLLALFQRRKPFPPFNNFSVMQSLTFFSIDESDVDIRPTQDQMYSLSNLAAFKLDLSYNKLGDHGMAALFKAFVSTGPPSIKELNLAGNGITNRSLDHCTKVLRHGKQLESLDLSHNLLTWKGLWEIQKALEDNKSFKSLNLTRNKGIRSNLGRLKEFLIKAATSSESIDIVCSQFCEVSVNT